MAANTCCVPRKQTTVACCGRTFTFHSPIPPSRIPAFLLQNVSSELTAMELFKLRQTQTTKEYPPLHSLKMSELDIWFNSFNKIYRKKKNNEKDMAESSVLFGSIHRQPAKVIRIFFSALLKGREEAIDLCKRKAPFSQKVPCHSNALLSFGKQWVGFSSQLFTKSVRLYDLLRKHSSVKHDGKRALSEGEISL